jgi:hypothetical protein
LAAFLQIDKLLPNGQKMAFLISDFKFDQTNAAGSIGHLRCCFENVFRSPWCQEVEVILEGNGGTSKTVSCRIAGLIRDGENSPSMSLW